MDDSIQAQPGTGKTVIADSAVAKVAGIAARAVPGVHSLGGGTARALGAIRGAVGNSDHVTGVRAEVGETQVAVDVDLVATYGYRFVDLASAVRAAVYEAVENLVGLAVIEVNIEILDVQLPNQASTGTTAADAPVSATPVTELPAEAPADPVVEGGGADVAPALAPPLGEPPLGAAAAPPSTIPSDVPETGTKKRNTP